MNSLHKDFSSTSKHYVRDTTECETERVQISPSQNICITHTFRVYMQENESEFPNEQNLKWRKIKKNNIRLSMLAQNTTTAFTQTAHFNSAKHTCDYLYYLM